MPAPTLVTKLRRSSMFLSSILLAANLVVVVVVVEAMGGAKAMAELTKSARMAEDRTSMLVVIGMR